MKQDSIRILVGHPNRMSSRHLLLVLGCLLVGLGAIEGNWRWLAVWAGTGLVALGVAHLRGSPGVFGKRPDGTLPFWSWVVFLPLLAYVLLVWHLMRVLLRDAAWQSIDEHLTVGRRLLPSELDATFDNYVDLTAEFAEPAAVRRSAAYRCFPILDGAAPRREALRAAVESLRPGRTFVHCAQGCGRTGLFALAILLHSGAVSSVEEGLRKLRAVRPCIRLSFDQQQCIQQYAQQDVNRPPGKAAPAGGDLSGATSAG
jgi:hypothetical protein